MLKQKRSLKNNEVSGTISQYKVVFVAVVVVVEVVVCKSERKGFLPTSGSCSHFHTGKRSRRRGEWQWSRSCNDRSTSTQLVGILIGKKDRGEGQQPQWRRFINQLTQRRCFTIFNQIILSFRMKNQETHYLFEFRAKF